MMPALHVHLRPGQAEHFGLAPTREVHELGYRLDVGREAAQDGTELRLLEEPGTRVGEPGQTPAADERQRVARRRRVRQLRGDAQPFSRGDQLGDAEHLVGVVLVQQRDSENASAESVWQKSSRSACGVRDG
jgi:hypothetical protein